MDLKGVIAEPRQALGLDFKIFVDAGDISAVVREGVAENIKRVHIQRITDRQWYETDDRHSPWMIEPFVEMKTIWHPSAT